MYRRAFFQLPALLAKPWASSPPPAYLTELQSLMRAAPVPGVVIGTVRDFKPGWIAPLGVRAAGSTDSITKSTLFQAASLTKQITAYAAFALHEKGKLDFDRPLVSYVDDLPKAREVTIRHVLSHSSGFPNWRYADAGKPVPDLVSAFPPGSKYQYSGEGFFYLQRVMEEVTSQGIGQIVSDLVFKPLEMRSTSMVWNPDTLDRSAMPHNNRGEFRANRDRGPRRLYAHAAKLGKPVEQLRYADYSSKELTDQPLPNNLIPNAAASLVTSAEDYTRFLCAALKNPEIGKQQVTINEFLGWGLGWATEHYASHEYVWQWGDNPGFKNFILGEPSTGSAIFVFTNGDSGARVYDRVITHATGHDHPALFWL